MLRIEDISGIKQNEDERKKSQKGNTDKYRVSKLSKKNKKIEI